MIPKENVLLFQSISTLFPVRSLAIPRKRIVEENEVVQQKGPTEIEAIHGPGGVRAHSRAIPSPLTWTSWLLGAPGLLKKVGENELWSQLLQVLAL